MEPTATPRARGSAILAAALQTDRATEVAAISPRKRQALGLFSVLSPRYTAATVVLSGGQDGRWRRALLDAVACGGQLTASSRVLDVATGTGLVAQALVHRNGCTVVGLDQSEQMLAAARERIDGDARLRGRVTLVQGEAERLPFADGEFDALTFTYLLRYVDDPAQTMRELARVVRPGGRICMMEFAVPDGRIEHSLWWLHTRVGLPLLGRLISPQWAGAGRFLGPSITDFYRRHPLWRVADYWREAGMHDVRVQRISLGAGVVISGTRDGVVD